MKANGRRSSPEVLKEILAAGPGTWSHLRFTVGLNHSQARRYLPFLVNEGYLQRRARDDGTVKYVITERGAKLLCLLSELSDFVGASLAGF